MTKNETDELIQAEHEILAAGMALQEQGLSLLLAEMRALNVLMSGAIKSEAERPEAEQEAAFDNMPV